ncbi:hypothetical protein Pcinc_031281 [Petrolisthes cinctipes]|uniref:Uncharacterized protein n=1 Tax=Petrolisthes cinctipes TaxID=88211 RepID=A0AAE1EWZ2_PETCI|nr:hypothetical protein Pcinc_031281 [Petrolisthes cinctipes]
MAEEEARRRRSKRDDDGGGGGGGGGGMGEVKRVKSQLWASCSVYLDPVCAPCLSYTPCLHTHSATDDGGEDGRGEKEEEKMKGGGRKRGEG